MTWQAFGPSVTGSRPVLMVIRPELPEQRVYPTAAVVCATRRWLVPPDAVVYPTAA